MTEPQIIERILKDIERIPPLPEVATKVMQMTNDPDVSAAELNKVISTDEALTADLLKLCNSAYYGLPRVISSVTQAIMYLGFQTVRNMVLSTAIDRVYARQDLSIYSFTQNGLSEHSFATAVAAQTVARKLRPGLSDTAFTAGLLHDVGKIILGKYVKVYHSELLKHSYGQSINRNAEKVCFGADHAEVGARIAENWNFPQELALAIGFHHAPQDAPGRPLLAVITYLANHVALRLGCGLSNGPIIETISDYCAESTGFAENDIPELCSEVEEALKSFLTPTKKS